MGDLYFQLSLYLSLRIRCQKERDDARGQLHNALTLLERQAQISGAIQHLGNQVTHADVRMLTHADGRMLTYADESQISGGITTCG